MELKSAKVIKKYLNIVSKRYVGEKNIKTIN